MPKVAVARNWNWNIQYRSSSEEEEAQSSGIEKDSEEDDGEFETTDVKELQRQLAELKKENKQLKAPKEEDSDKDYQCMLQEKDNETEEAGKGQNEGYLQPDCKETSLWGSRPNEIHKLTVMLYLQ